ncbi:MAG TPA: ABC transporter ATP-binding protein [Chthoniobacterales bacterium]|jgi:ABC-2 type transport system ATP-binding protein
MTNPAVTVRGLTKVFSLPFRRCRLIAVRDLNLEVARGQVYGLLGPNGSGKSTTLKIILGLVSPTKGKTQIFGRDSRELGSRTAVGFLPENPYFYKYLTGEETLLFFGKLSGLHGRGLQARTNELLALVRLEEARHRRLGGYSKGMLQRIGLAQALLPEPKLVVLDEPTAGVDPEGSREIRDLILDLKSRGITVLLSSHLLTQVQEICDHVSILSHGVIVREGRVENLLTIENQTELVLENATPEILAEIRGLLERSGTCLVEQRQPKTSLEQLFLEATRAKPSG